MWPPVHFPFFRAATCLSRVRSEMISRSNCANDSRIFSVSRPSGVFVLNCWVIETKQTPRTCGRRWITNWSRFVPVAEALPRLVPNSDSRLILLIRHAQASGAQATGDGFCEGDG